MSTTFSNPGLIEVLQASGPPVFDNWKKNSSLTVDKTGLTITTSSWNWGTARATVKVHKGRWYYEVKIASSGQARIGWATENYAPESTSDGVGSDSDSFGWDGSRRTVHHDEKKNKPTDYGENWNSGDVIGCLLDFDNAIISYSRNGKSMGPAFKNIKTINALMPCVSVYNRASLTVELGPNFKHLPLGFYGVNPTVSASQKKSLSSVFVTYHKKGTTLSESLSRDLIKMNGVLALAQDLGGKDPMDPHLLLLAWKMRSKQFFQFYECEWMVLWANEKVSSFDEMKTAVNRWKNDVFNGKGAQNEDNYLSFYMFVFDYLRAQEGETKLVLSRDDAIMAWNLLGINKKWKLFPKWEAFWKQSNRMGVPRDTWQVLLKFIANVGDDMKNYSEDDCWPMVFDDFAEFIQKNK